jgi:hypothetical protein
MTFDEQVKALRGKVVPKQTKKKKSNCTPKEWAAKLEYLKSWSAANPGRRLAISKEWLAANPDKHRKAKREWARSNPEKSRAMAKSWRDRNPDKFRKSRNERYKNDPVFRMLCNLRARQNKFFKGKSRPLSMVRDMGCTQEFLRQHIASQLAGEMTMENYGKVWHLDHIYPLSQADIVGNPVHFLAVANWRNLQPMLGPENVEKSDEITPEAQALFDSLCAEFARAAA